MRAKIRWGVDFDGVLADTSLLKKEWIRVNLDLEVEAWCCDRTSCVPLIGEERYEEMSENVFERESSLRAPAVPGAIEALRQLAASGQVYIITTRPPPRLEHALEWLALQGGSDLVTEFLSSAGTRKAELCLEHGLSAHIDDDDRHLRPLIGTGTRPLLFRPGLPQSELSPGGIPCFSTWEDVVAELNR